MAEAGCGHTITILKNTVKFFFFAVPSSTKMSCTIMSFFHLFFFLKRVIHLRSMTIKDSNMLFMDSSFRVALTWKTCCSDHIKLNVV